VITKTCGPVTIGDYFCELAPFVTNDLSQTALKKSTHREPMILAQRLVISLKRRAEGGRLLTEQDIWDAAASMIGRYGFDAPVVAADRSDALTEKGMIDESETWQRILRAILRLLAEKPAPGETVH
jgi:hypothetical protein